MSLSALRLARQGLLCPAQDEPSFDALFRALSPVAPLNWSRPGSVPTLQHRAAFDQAAHCFSLRQDRVLLKGRFARGCVGYIFSDDLPLFCAVYKKEKPLSFLQMQILDILLREGPMSIQVLKEFTALRSKDITPALHALQEQFLVLEDQTDDEWDRPWYAMENEYPDLLASLPPRGDAIDALLLRFAFAHGAIDASMVRSFYSLSLREARESLARLQSRGALLQKEGLFLLPQDEPLFSDAAPPAPSVFALHRSDFLVRSFAHDLRGCFARPGCDVLYDLLIDGEFRGAILGHFRQGPFDVEDILLDLPAAQALSRRDEILRAARSVLSPQDSPIRRYLGQPLLP